MGRGVGGYLKTLDPPHTLGMLTCPESVQVELCPDVCGAGLFHPAPILTQIV